MIKQNYPPQRDPSIDMLRFIAISGIILIHIEPSSELVCQLRGFDVPLMVFLSGVSFYLSSRRQNKETYLAYCKKRFIRLILPAWIFMAFYYTTLSLICVLLNRAIPVSPNELLHCFSFTTGWYVWIIRVLFIIALIAPVIRHINFEKMSRGKILLLCLLILLFFEPIGHFIKMQEDYYNEYWYYLAMNIPYIIIFIMGYVVHLYTKQNMLYISLFAFGTYCILAVSYIIQTETYQNTSVAKYPPMLYYTSYAIAVVMILFAYKNKIQMAFHMLKLETLTTFVGTHSIWIYFWHIPIINIGLKISDNYLIRYLFVYTVAVAITSMQVQMVNYITQLIRNDNIKKNVKQIFLG